MEITREQAGRFMLLKQGLLGSYRFYGKEGAVQYVRQAGCIQYDPVDVCGKNAELTLQSRVKGFQKQTLQELLYKDRMLVDYSDKEIAIFPTEDWPYFSRYRERSIRHGKRFNGLSELEKEAIEYIAEHGPVSSATLPIEGEIFWHSSMHWSGNWHKKSQAARSVLEQLYTDGTLVIHHKEGSRKYYDLAERHLPADLLMADTPISDEQEWICWRVRRRIGAVGMLWNRCSDAFLGIDMTTDQRNQAFIALLETGEIREISIEGIRWPFYILEEDMQLLQDVAAGCTDNKARCEFLAPLDPMLWDRRLIHAVFGYQYTWEIYTPAGKRRYGYYVLPVVYGDRFAGRIEAAADRKNNTLIVKNLWYEEGIRQTKKLGRAILQSSRKLAKFNDCTQVLTNTNMLML